jgi:hypothetical protein
VPTDAGIEPRTVLRVLTSAAVEDAGARRDKIRMIGEPFHHPEAGVLAKPNLAHVAVILEICELRLIALLPVTL